MRHFHWTRELKNFPSLSPREGCGFSAQCMCIATAFCSEPHSLGELCLHSLSLIFVYVSAFARSGEKEYQLTLRSDLYCGRHTQWFYFQVEGMEANTPYQFHIVNLRKPDSLYNHGKQCCCTFGNSDIYPMSVCRNATTTLLPARSRNRNGLEEGWTSYNLWSHPQQLCSK